MALQSSGRISIRDIINKFAPSKQVPHRMRDLYEGGSVIPTVANGLVEGINRNIPAIQGTRMRVSDFYGADLASPGVKLYDGLNETGSLLGTFTTTSTLNFSTQQSKTSSISVPSGYKIRLYENANPSGTWVEIQGPLSWNLTGDFGFFDNKAKYINIISTSIPVGTTPYASYGGPIELFDTANARISETSWSGTKRVTYSTNFNSLDIDVRSVWVQNGYKAILWDDFNLTVQGQSTTDGRPKGYKLEVQGGEIYHNINSQNIMSPDVNGGTNKIRSVTAIPSSFGGPYANYYRYEPKFKVGTFWGIPANIANPLERNGGAETQWDIQNVNGTPFTCNNQTNVDRLIDIRSELPENDQTPADGTGVYMYFGTAIGDGTASNFREVSRIRPDDACAGTPQENEDRSKVFVWGNDTGLVNSVLAVVNLYTNAYAYIQYFPIL